jgi:hypothetical protein
MVNPRDPFEQRQQILGGARSARPLDGVSYRGRHGGLTGPPRGTLVADADTDGKTRAHSGSKPKPKGNHSVSTKEITVIGSFKNPFNSLGDEIKAMKENRWSPSTDDFSAVAGRSLTVDSYLGLLTVILADGDRETQAGSIKRINIFTHANKDMIALSGRISAGGVLAQVFLNVDSSLSVDTLDKLNQEGVTFSVPSKSKQLAAKKFTLDDVKKRFATDAVIVVYACHSGLDGVFVQYLADTFQVKVRGFSDVIGYFPKYEDQPASVNRRRVGIGYNSKVIESDFHRLDASGTAIEKSPKR